MLPRGNKKCEHRGDQKWPNQKLEGWCHTAVGMGWAAQAWAVIGAPYLPADRLDRLAGNSKKCNESPSRPPWHGQWVDSSVADPWVETFTRTIPRGMDN